MIACHVALKPPPSPISFSLIRDFDSECQAEVTWLTRRPGPFDLRWQI